MYRFNFVNNVDMNEMRVSLYPDRSHRYYAESPMFSFELGLSYTNLSTESMEYHKERGVRLFAYRTSKKY